MVRVFLFLIYTNMELSKPWWIALPAAIVKELWGFAFVLVLFPLLIALQIIARGGFAVTFGMFVAACGLALAFDDLRWLSRRAVRRKKMNRP